VKKKLVLQSGCSSQTEQVGTTTCLQLNLLSIW